MKKNKTFEQACKKLGIDPNKLPDVSGIDESIGKDIVTTYKLLIARKSIVGDWKADVSKLEDRWYPVFIWDNSVGAFRFYVAYYVSTGADASSGARFACQTEAQAIKFGKDHIELWNELLK